MRAFLLGMMILVCNENIHAQARIILNNNPYLVLQNGVRLVIDNAAANAITTTGAGGNIISENENNKIKWNIGTGIGFYVVPFTTASHIKIPLEMQINSPGTGSGFIEFSTYGGANWDNLLYRPTTVTNMTNDGVFDNSSEVIDRFWIITTNGYLTKPSGIFNFTYDDAEHLAVGNTISEEELMAERYYPVANSWDAYAPSGSANITTNRVEGASFSDADFFANWTLIDQTSHLLPITLLNFYGECNDGITQLHWSTTEELDTWMFDIYAGNDGISFEKIGSVPAAGISSSLKEYSFIPEMTADYYQLRIHYLDNSSIPYEIIYSPCENSNTMELFVAEIANGTIQVTCKNIPAGNYQLQLINSFGQWCMSDPVHTENTSATFLLNNDRLSPGIYFIQLTNGNSIRLVKELLLHP